MPMKLIYKLVSRTNTRTFHAMEIALLIGVTAQVKVDLFPGTVDGFVIALDVIIMGVFIYCYDDIKPHEIVALAALFSPLFRTLFMTIGSHSFQFSAVQALPDSVFFIGYGLTYAFIDRFLVENPKEFMVFPYVVFFSDIFGNMMELLVRSMMVQQLVYTAISISLLIVIALFRMVALVILIVAIDAYSNKLLQGERIKEYERMLEKFSIIQEEITLMDKNASEVEASMREAYDLYQILDSDKNCPARTSRQALEIAKRTHEIKADYYNVISVLKSLFDESEFRYRTRLSSTIRLVVRNISEYAQKQGVHLGVKLELNADCEISDNYKTISILRNLMMNSVDAMTKKGSGIIRIRVDYEGADNTNRAVPVYILTIEDNGAGIPEDRMGSIFRAGYSTRFNVETGYIQRGLGLSIVKTYVENDFGGRIEVESQVGEFTRFRIALPEEVAVGGCDEVLHS